MMLEARRPARIDLEALAWPSGGSLPGGDGRRAENDGYNALVLAAGWSGAMSRSSARFSRYLRQIRVPYSQDYMWATLRKHAAIAAQIVRPVPRPLRSALGMTPEQRASAKATIAADDRERARSGREPRRGPHPAPLRQCGARPRSAPTSTSSTGRRSRKRLIAIKFDSRKLDDLPLPRPLYEIFVYSPRVEGVHLRFGKVARGGIRWSDRPQDFRTEILGLVKAQQVKNAVIVPVGAKGGFVPKRLPPPATARRMQAEGIAAYKLFISRCSTSPTISDRRHGVVPPADVVRHDGDDPYLVVAADKGTATFSDIANAIAAEHGFWLGDAFASGGSAGYDHKKMGITARGAWEAVKRHFREMDVDIARRRSRRRRRRHVGRRLRQRHAARADDQARRRVRSSRHLHRSRSRSGHAASPSASACSICRVRAGRITTSR